MREPKIEVRVTVKRRRHKLERIPLVRPNLPPQSIYYCADCGRAWSRSLVVERPPTHPPRDRRLKGRRPK